MNDYEQIIHSWALEFAPVDNPKSTIMARINIDIKNPPLVIKGFTLGKNEKGELFVSPPRYKNRYHKWNPLVFMPYDMLQILNKKVVKEYEDSITNGNQDASQVKRNNQEIDIGEINF